jgi:putative addiction module CopG family antidote
VPQAEQRSVTLPPEQARYIDALVASGAYDSSNAVVLAALRAFQAREDALARWVKLQVVPVLGALQPRRDWSVPDGTAGVIVELGANDMFQGTAPAATRKALSDIVAKLKARGQAVLLAGMMAPTNMGPEYAAAFNRIFPDLAAEQGVLLYPFFLEGVATDRRLNLPDGIHPTAKGIAKIVTAILPSVEKLIAQTGKGK